MRRVGGQFGVGGSIRDRRGFVLVMALVVLLVISSLCAEQVRRALSDRRQEQRELLRVQTDAAADAALRLAEQRLAADAGWAGAEWTVPAGMLSAETVITVSVQVQNGIITANARASVENNLMCSATRTGEKQT
jgi:Tfp pilus assembly protein PilX